MNGSVKWNPGSGGMPRLAWAMLAVPASPAAAPQVPGMAGELVRVVLSLVAVVAVILLAGWLTRRAQARVRPGGRRVRCVESLAVGVKERVLLLEVGGRQLLVGASAGGLRTLLVLDEPVAEDTPEQAAPAGFRDVLAQWRKRS